MTMKSWILTSRENKYKLNSLVMKAAKKWFYRHPVRDEILPISTLAEELGKMAEHDSKAKHRLVDQYQTPVGIVKVWEKIES